MIDYRIENNPTASEFREVLIASTLGERRPVNDLGKLAKMIDQADIVITARQGGRLIGIARSVSDFAYCTYLSDLAVEAAFQNQGIGKELIRQTRMAAPETKLILLAAPAATGYYPKVGMTRHEHCYFLNKEEELR